MHVCVILDDAGFIYNRSWQDSKEILKDRCQSRHKALGAFLFVLQPCLGVQGASFCIKHYAKRAFRALLGSHALQEMERRDGNQR